MTRRAMIALVVLLLFVGCYRAPNAPVVPSGPSAVAKDTFVRFSSAAIDPDGDDVCIRFDWGEGDTSDWSQYVASGESVSRVHKWSAVGPYSVRAQASDVTGGPSAWSPAHLVQVAEWRAPAAPAVPSGPSPVWEDSSAVFISMATDPDGDSVSIRFDWGDGDTSDWGSPVASGETVAQAHSWADVGVFQVKAQARDEHDAMSGWSAPAQVTITTPLGTLRWRYQTGGRVLSSPAIGQDGTIYFGSEDSCLYAVKQDGSLSWRYRTGDRIVNSSPAVGADGAVYVGSIDCYLYCLNPDGALRWRFPTGGGISSSPALGSDGTVYFGSEDFRLYALNPNGSRKWSFRTGNAVKSSPAIGLDGTIYVGSHDDHLYALRPDSTLRWSYPVSDAVCSSPSLDADGTIYFGSDGGRVTALHPDGTLKWTYLTGGAVGWSGAAISTDGNIYVGSFDGYLHAIDQSGTCAWKYHMGGEVGSSTPMVTSDGTIYDSPHGGTLYALSLDGELKWKYATGAQWCWSTAVGRDGTVYFGSDSCLYAIYGSGPLADTPWPKFHHDSKNTGRVGGGR